MMCYDTIVSEDCSERNPEDQDFNFHGPGNLKSRNRHILEAWTLWHTKEDVLIVSFHLASPLEPFHHITILVT